MDPDVLFVDGLMYIGFGSLLIYIVKVAVQFKII